MATANTTEKCPVQIQQKGPSDVDDETGGASDTCSAASDVSPTHLTAHARRCSNCAQLQQQAGSASPTKSPTKSMRRLSNATTNSVTRLDTNKQKSEMKSPAVSSPMLARPSTAKPSPVAKQGPSSILIIGGWTPEGRTAAVTCLDISDGALDLAEDITPLPYAWSDASVTADQQGTCIYVTGGRAEVKAGRGVEERLDQAAKYDVKARKWSRLLQLNIPREEHCSFVLGGRLYVVGGWDAVDHHDSMESLALTGQTKPVWKKEASLPLPLWQAAICLVKGKVYLTGGHKETPYNHLMEWGARQTKWRPLESMTHARYGHSMCTDEVGHLWVIGGDSGSSVESYNIKTSQWTMLSPLPLWRRDTGCVYHNGVIVVPGGWGKIKDARGGQTNDIWMYDVGGDTWTQPDTKLHQTISCCRVLILPRISSK